jgi:hypothetical protein
MIYTDTMIWYTLLANEPNIQHLKKIGVRPSIVNIEEIGSSHNLVYNPKPSKKTIVNLLRFQDNLQNYHPLRCFINQTQNIVFENPFQDEIMASLLTVINDDDFEYKIGFVQKDVLSLVNSEKEKFEFATNQAMNILKVIQSNVNKFTPDQKNDFIHNRLNNYEGIYNYFNHISTESLGIQLNKEEFFKRELFVKVINRFFLDLELSIKKIIKPNDWNDLMQLLYVREGDYYWTKEKKWLKLINQLGLGHYLFDGEIYLHKYTK